jgi:dihydroneopterin aldolase
MGTEGGLNGFFVSLLRIRTLINKADMTGIIDLEEMEFYAYHGCYQEEKVVGNRFLVNVSIRTSIKKPVGSDNIKDALNYVKVYELVREEMQQTSNLLEHVTGRIMDSLYEHFPFIEWARIKVSKMNPPMGGQMKKVSLTMER